MQHFKTDAHEWIKVEGKIATVGISAYAKEAMGEIVHIEMPEINRIYKKNDTICVLESQKSAFDLYAPLEGKIIEINEKLLTEVDLINQDPENRGWLYKMELVNLKALQ